MFLIVLALFAIATCSADVPCARMNIPILAPVSNGLCMKNCASQVRSNAERRETQSMCLLTQLAHPHQLDYRVDHLFQLCYKVLFLILLPAACLAQVDVVGNLAVVANPEGHIGTPDKHLEANIPNLWCGAQKLGEHIDVEYGEFTRLATGHVTTGVLKHGKVYLNISHANVKVAGKYRCEVRTKDKEVHSGNIEIYLPPVLYFRSSNVATEIPDARPPHVVGTERRGLHDEKMTLECPAVAYPEPSIRWEKNGEPIVPTNNTQYDGENLILYPLTFEHAGKYRCIADNSFPLFVDGPAMPHQIYYDQIVKNKVHYNKQIENKLTAKSYDGRGVEVQDKS
ncbi:unnamed protein product [Caenorhabditis bovis]|uniref:Ig-like domain-containing protein n=1 Tax=Caenorhabditis bovis TaxID=2654633 RepID=A0A8S1F899_9PELO|nr:unnamed protein product [Caenorhabditis bovis]